MTPLFRSRQDAEELHDALAGRATPEAAQRQADLVRTVSLLTAHEPVRPRPEFSAVLREQLLAAAETDLVAAPAVQRRTPSEVTPARSTTRRRLGTLAASLAIVGGTAGMAAAAQGALPGDPLYPIKRGGEQVVAALQPGSSGLSDLDRASERLREAQALQDRGADPALAARSVDDFRELAQRGAGTLLQDYRSDGDPESVRAVRDLAATELPRLDALAEADPEVEPSALAALDALTSIDDQARTLCPGCSTAEALPLPSALSQGAGAASLSSLLSAPAEQARLDARTLQSLDAEQVRRLGEAAERQAGNVPLLPGGETWPVVGSSPRGPVGSTLVTDLSGTVDGTVGEVVRGTTGAVDGLVGGLRDGLGTVTSGSRDGAVGGAVGGLSDTVDQALGGVSGVTGSLGGR